MNEKTNDVSALEVEGVTFDLADPELKGVIWRFIDVMFVESGDGFDVEYNYDVAFSPENDKLFENEAEVSKLAKKRITDFIQTKVIDKLKGETDE